MATCQGLRGLLASQLHRPVDGRGLVRSSQVPSKHRWVTVGTTNVRGGAFVNAIKIRCGLVATALRRSRGQGFPNYDKSCDCCGRTESLGHILQLCPRTHASHITILWNKERPGWAMVLSGNRPYQQRPGYANPTSSWIAVNVLPYCLSQ